MNLKTAMAKAQKLLREKLLESEPPERMFWLDIDGPPPEGFSGMIIEFATEDTIRP